MVGMEKVVPSIFSGVVLLAALLYSTPLSAQNFSEGFESGLPSAYDTSPTDHVLSSGTWNVVQVLAGTKNMHSGSFCAQIKQGSVCYATAPAVDGVSSVKFWARGGKSVSGALLVQKSVNGGAFTIVQTFAVTDSATEYTCTVNDPGNNIRIRLSSGNQTTLYVDDLTVTSSTATIVASLNELPPFGNVIAGSNSSSSSYSVAGSNLDGDIIIKASPGFRVSLDNTLFDTTALLPQSGGNVGQTAVYVRFTPFSADGSESGVISNASGSVTRSVSVSGIAIAPEPTSQSAITFGAVTGSSIAVNFSGGNGGRRIIVARADSAVSWSPFDGSGASSNSNFSAALDQGSGNKVVYDGSGVSVNVTGLMTGRTYYFAAFECNAGTNNSENYLQTAPGTGSQKTLIVAELTANPSSLSFGDVVISSHTQRLYLLTGKNLTPTTGHVTVAAPAGFQVSIQPEASYAASLQIPFSGGAFSETVYVRFNPGAIQSYNDTIVNSGGGAAAMAIALSGRGVSTLIQPDSKPFGFASCGTGTTGGIGGDSVLVTTAQQLFALMTPRQKNVTTPLRVFISGTLSSDSGEVEIKRTANVTVMGVGADATLHGFGFKIVDSQNIIVRNLTFADCTAGEGDAVSIEGCSNVWVDHCSFTDSPGDPQDESHDGQTDVKKESIYITLSWNHYMNHRKTCLLGHSVSETGDTAMRVTYIHNWFDGTYSRHPRARYGSAHIVNNFYSSVGSGGGYGVGSTCQAQLFVEGNYFENTSTPTLISLVNDTTGTLSGDPPGYLKGSKNFLSNSGSIVENTAGFNFDPATYYSYTAENAQSVKQLVMDGAGAGRLGNPVTALPASATCIPEFCDLRQNYPNPFNPSTKISYDLPRATHISLVVYNMVGQIVARLVDQMQGAGPHATVFSAENGYASGVYFYRLQTGDFVSVKKMILIK